MSATTVNPVTLSLTQSSKVELWFWRVAIVFGVASALAMLLTLGIVYWAHNEFSQPESIVAAQSMMLARDGTLYYGLKDYPYTVNAYMPVYYLLEAGLIRVGVAPYAAGRSISFAALLGILAVLWRIAMVYTSSRQCAWTAVLLAGSSTLLLTWGTTGQVDTLAVFFAVAAFHQFSRYYVRGETTLALAAVFAIAALMTKQTMVACPTAIFVALWFHRPKAALAFGAGVCGMTLAIVLGLNALTDGRFLANTVFANINPFVWDRLVQHIQFLGLAAGQLILVVAAGTRSAARNQGKAVLIYLGLALGVLMLTAPKIGSDSNYQIEPTVLLALGSCVVLHSLNFFPLLFAGSKTWITLLQAPLAIHIVLNLRMAQPLVMMRVVKEQMFRQQVSELRPLLADGGRVVSTDTNAMVHLRGRLEVEPLIYTILVHGGKIDPERLTRDLGAKTFSAVVLYQDVNKPGELDPEIPSLPEPQLAELRKSYTLVKHVPGPYLDGLYVYKPQ